MNRSGAGVQPAKGRGRATSAPAQPPYKVATVADLAYAHLAHLRRRVRAGTLSPSTLAATQSRYAAAILPHLGSSRLATLRPGAVLRWHDSVSQHRRVLANRAVSVLRQGWKIGILMGLIDPSASNPFDILSTVRNRETPRSRVLTDRELDLLLMALRRESTDTGNSQRQRAAVVAIWLMLETGARREEILGLTWDQVDTQHRRLYLSSTKTGPKAVVLSATAASLLESWRSRSCGTGTDKVFDAGYSWRSMWNKIRKGVGATDLTLHDLRRTFSSRLAEAGVPAEDVAKLMGQRSVSVNIRHYRSIGQERMNALADAAAGQLHRRVK